MNIGIILAAGNSVRFHNASNKLLYKLNNKPVIKYSTDILCKYLDQVIIITNSDCRTKIRKLFSNNKQINLVFFVSISFNYLFLFKDNYTC